jgi:hypothetical protein
MEAGINLINPYQLYQPKNKSAFPDRERERRFVFSMKKRPFSTGWVDDDDDVDNCG